MFNTGKNRLFIPKDESLKVMNTIVFRMNLILENVDSLKIL